jgi:hypothetical protein
MTVLETTQDVGGKPVTSDAAAGEAFQAPPENATRGERWGAASGFAALVAGLLGGALERGWPSGSDPHAVARFIAANRPAILAQSMLFVLSTGIYLWFLSSLCTFLRRAEGSAGTVVRTGPLAPNGWLTYALYPVFALWLLPAAIVMLRRSKPGTR